jgi:hypothetical protein
MMSRYDLWKETAAWWHLEGEACDQRSLRWFGPDYSAGIPKNIYILDPRRMRNEEPLAHNAHCVITHENRRWFYQTDTDIIPILRDELIHFRDWPSAVSHPVRLFRAASVRCRRHPCRLFLPLVGADYGTSPCGLVPLEPGKRRKPPGGPGSGT